MISRGRPRPRCCLACRPSPRPAKFPGAAGVLAQVLTLIDPAAAERQTARRSGRRPWPAATTGRRRSVAGDLVDLCRGSGRLAEALTLADQKAGYTRQAGLGPWTQLVDEVRRLQVLNEMGRAGEVLAEVRAAPHAHADTARRDEPGRDR